MMMVRNATDDKLSKETDSSILHDGDGVDDD